MGFVIIIVHIFIVCRFASYGSVLMQEVSALPLSSFILIETSSIAHNDRNRFKLSNFAIIHFGKF